MCKVSRVHNVLVTAVAASFFAMNAWAGLNPCTPAITIQSLLGCLQPGATCPPSVASYGPAATGYSGTTGIPLEDNPAFCYIIIVRNTGLDPLTNIVIHDDQLGALGTFPGPLAVGGTITISNLRTNWASTTTNTATVTADCGGGNADGTPASASASSVAIVLPAGLVCQKLVSVNGGTPVQDFSSDCSVAPTNITWYVTVTNTGLGILCNILVNEFGSGPEQLLCPPSSLSLTNCLAPGQGTGLIPICSVGYSNCVEIGITNSIRVYGFVASVSNACGISMTGSNIVAVSQCDASLTLHCQSLRLSITKSCASGIVTNVGSSLTVTGMVCNLGSQDLINVTIVDSQPGLPTAMTNVIPLLPAGQCSGYSFTYTATSCDPNHDVVTAIGTSLCGTPVGPVSASADCFLCCPGISIATMVGCLLPGATCPPSGASYSPAATGYSGTTGIPLQDNPAFCYIMVVRNTGHDPLTNIVINDDQLGRLGTFPGPLAVGGTITISNLRTNWATTTTNTASVSAQCGGVHANGAMVGATASAVAQVLPAGLICQKLVSVNGGTPVQDFSSDCSVAPTNIIWYVAVTNTGGAVLCNILVNEFGSGPEQLPCTPSSLSLTNCLAPGQGTGLIPICSVGFSNCVEIGITNSIRVYGVVASVSNVCEINMTGSNIVAVSQCDASLTLHCQSLSITKSCASGIVTNVGSSLTVTGMVCNLGSQDLTNVTIVDSQPGLPTTMTNVIPLLPAGQCSGYSFTYLATSCDPNHDVVTAIGTSLCGTPVGPASASADCFLCCPGISIATLVGCLQPGAVCPPSSASYAATATGVRGDTGSPDADDPAFCYIIVVRNTGHDPLTNIVINDDQLGHLGTFPGPLAVGGTITISNLRTNWDTTTTNTASVSAQCDGVHANGAVVGATASAVAIVVQASIIAQKLVSVNGSTPVQVATPACGVIASNIAWYVIITNTGEAFMCNIRLEDAGTGPDLLPCGAFSISLSNCLAPGESTGPILLCTNGFGTCVTTNLVNTIRVIAEAVSISNVCTVSITGTNVQAESQCVANLALCCVPASPENGCRVTGGGRQDSPETCPDDVRYVTHGGQVGGPLGSPNCVVTLDQIMGSQCIRGRWTHVRHIKSGPQSYFQAHYFDTLACACLGDGIINTNNCEYEQGIVVDGICNPADGNGRREGGSAPANKIAFTGVGEWSYPSGGGRAPGLALFRVDIEDRGEPGGTIPKHGQPPPSDRYRIRIWVLTHDELLRLRDPADGLIDIPAGCSSCTTISRNAIRACVGLTFQDGVCGPNNCASDPNGQACFALPGSIPVRLPDIDDGGELKNGNEQILPQIKTCP